MQDILNSSEFWSAVFGAVVGGGIAWLIQLQSLREARQQREEQERQRRQALGHSLLFKMTRINSHLVRLDRSVRITLEERKKNIPQAEWWALFQPIVNPFDEVRFSDEELAFLLSMQDNELFNSVASLDEVHNGTIQALDFLSDRRSRLLEMLPAFGDGEVGEIRIPTDQVPLVRPRMIEINHLVDALLKQLKRDSIKSERALMAVSIKLRDKLNFPYSVKMLPDDELNKE